jgi:hypothetical protein
MHQQNEYLWKLLLTTTILIFSCVVPSFPAPAIPTSDPGDVKTIIIQTAVAASTQTAIALPSATKTLTFTPTASNTFTPTSSPDLSFFTPWPTLGLASPTPTLSPRTKTPLASRTPPIPTGPSSATLTSPVPTDTPITPTPCPSPFSCQMAQLPPLNLPAGGPNNPDFKPCSATKGFPWISVETENNPDTPNKKKNDLEQGQRAYYFACEFPDAANLMAEMNGPGCAQTPPTVLPTIPNLDLQMHNAQAVVVWNATCDLQPGENVYTLKMWDGTGSQAQLAFSLQTTRFQRILATPYQSGPASTIFQLYYCGYAVGTEVVVDFYYGVKRSDLQGGYDFFHTESWNVLIDSSSCVVKSLTSLPGDPTRIYLINDREAALKGFDYIWLTP